MWWPLLVGGLYNLPIIILTSRSCCRCALSAGGSERGQEDLSVAPHLCPPRVPQSGSGLQVTSESQDWRSEKWLQINDGIYDYELNLKISYFFQFTTFEANSSMIEFSIRKNFDKINLENVAEVYPLTFNVVNFEIDLVKTKIFS